jgi:hypothetical protein
MMVMMFLRKLLLHYTRHTLNIKLSMLHDGVVLCLGVSTFIGIEKVSIGGKDENGRNQTENSSTVFYFYI